jgi:hypothetical protein
MKKVFFIKKSHNFNCVISTGKYSSFAVRWTKNRKSNCETNRVLQLALFTIFIFTLLSFSCRLDNLKDEIKYRSFWAEDVRTGLSYKLQAALLAEGEKCNVWVEKGAYITEDAAKRIADEYDNEIYQKMKNAFSFEDTVNYNGQIFSNIMEFADFLGDGDGKLCILLLDIRDNYRNDGNETYVAGYFSAYNFLNYNNSNYCDMIYLDINPGIPGSFDFFCTIAHEVQHLMNFCSSLIFRGKINSIGILNVKLMDTWIDEGLAGAAEWLYSGEHPEIRWKWFNKDPSGLIKKGNNFFIWGNHQIENQNAVMDDYSTTYLFFQWLRLQSGSSSIYKKLITSENFNYEAVTDIISGEVSADYLSWETLLKTWMAANYINASGGPYGYKNDDTLKQIKANTIPDGATSLYLYPGEGVYSIIPDVFSTPVLGSEGNIRYVFLDRETQNMSDGSFSAGNALLTFNINTVNLDTVDNPVQREEGETTGICEPDDNTVTKGRYVKAPFKGPFPVGAGDVLRQDKKKSFNYVNFSRLINRTVIIK